MNNVKEVSAQMGGLQLRIAVEGKENIEKMEKNPPRKGSRYIFARVMGTRPVESIVTWIGKDGKLVQVPGRIKR